MKIKFWRQLILIMTFVCTISSYSLGAEKTLSVEEAIQNLQANGPSYESQFLHVVKTQGRSGVPALLSALSMSNDLVKRAAISGLILVKASCGEVASSLTPLFQDESWVVRSSVVGYASRMKCKEVVNPIRSLLPSEKNTSVLINALDALGRLGDVSDTEPLRSMEKNATAPLLLRLSASGALLQLKGVASNDVLLAGLNSQKEDENLKALMALSFSAELSWKSRLQPFLNQKDPIKTWATIAKKAIDLNQPSVTPTEMEKQLYSFFSETNSLQTIWSVYRLLEIRDGTVTDRLKEFIKKTKADGTKENEKIQSVVGSVLLDEGIISTEEYRRSFEN